MNDKLVDSPTNPSGLCRAYGFLWWLLGSHWESFEGVHLLAVCEGDHVDMQQYLGNYPEMSIVYLMEEL